MGWGLYAVMSTSSVQRQVLVAVAAEGVREKQQARQKRQLSRPQICLRTQRACSSLEQTSAGIPMRMGLKQKKRGTG